MCRQGLGFFLNYPRPWSFWDMSRPEVRELKRNTKEDTQSPKTRTSTLPYYHILCGTDTPLFGSVQHFEVIFCTKSAKIWWCDDRDIPFQHSCGLDRQLTYPRNWCRPVAMSGHKNTRKIFASTFRWNPCTQRKGKEEDKSQLEESAD